MPASPIPTPALSALAVLVPAGASLSPAQQRFNELLSRVEQLSAHIARLQAWEQHHRHAHLQAVHQAQQQTRALRRAIVLLLHERLQTGAMGTSQQRLARRLLRQWLGDLQDLDPQLQALARQYHDDDAQDVAEEAREAAQRLREQLEQAMGQPLERGASYETPEAVMAAAARQWQRQQDHQDARKAAKRAAKSAAKHAAKQTARLARENPDQTEAEVPDAQSALRTVFRQLASALHPDREPDAAERERKTVLMSEVNAAYGQGDLSTLLRLQVQVLQGGQAQRGHIADERLAAMALLLKDQIKALQSDLRHLEQRLSHELGLAVSATQDEGSMTRQLLRLQAQAMQALSQQEADWRRVQHEAEFKRWLKEQGAAMKEAALQAASVWD